MRNFFSIFACLALGAPLALAISNAKESLLEILKTPEAHLDSKLRDDFKELLTEYHASLDDGITKANDDVLLQIGESVFGIEILKPEIPKGHIAASAPPHTIRSALLFLIIVKESPIA